MRTLQTVQAGQRVERVVHQEVRAVTQSVQSVKRTVEALATATQATSVPTSAPTAQTVAHTDTVITKGAQVIQSASVVSTEAQAVAHEATPVSKGLVEETAVAVAEVPSASSAAVIERRAKRPSPPPDPPIASKAFKEVKLRSALAPKADYSWLADELYKSVEEHKGYPHLARTNRWEGQVTIMIVIGQVGPAVDLLDVKVVESSGYTLLDTHALDVIRGIFPLKVKHRLQQAQVSVRVPISFRMDQ